MSAVSVAVVTDTQSEAVSLLSYIRYPALCALAGSVLALAIMIFTEIRSSKK